MKYFWIFMVAVVTGIAIVIFGKEYASKPAASTNVSVNAAPVSQGSTALGGQGGGGGQAQGGQGGAGASSGSSGGGGGLLGAALGLVGL